MNQRGFTLVELLVALSVFALLSAMAMGVLFVSAQTQETISTTRDISQELERARSLLRDDTAQMINRPYRDVLSNDPIDGFVGGVVAASSFPDLDEEGEILFAFVRHGWVNAGAQAPRSSLQHVMYIRRDDDLVRRVRPYLDAVSGTPYADDIIFSDAVEMSVSFLGPLGWGATFTPQGGQFSPRAVRLEFLHPRYGAMRLDFLGGVR